MDATRKSVSHRTSHNALLTLNLPTCNVRIPDHVEHRIDGGNVFAARVHDVSVEEDLFHAHLGPLEGPLVHHVEGEHHGLGALEAVKVLGLEDVPAVVLVDGEEAGQRVDFGGLGQVRHLVAVNLKPNKYF